ncbi:MAG: GNAT family N-acetyltransferase [Pseudonocardia sp. SCN 73-27]|nr:MAG: GNAT family N-acetyltransferase [Pseudonocardia sp. SCN 72-51]ODV09203.1 MAG: GNAT family N-acetyltransferase [Pseudonocardia sp. SCN 73-27]
MAGVARTLAELPWPVTTERLSLRPATILDAAAVFGYRRLPEVGQWLTRLPDDLDAWRVRFAERLPTAIMIEEDGDVIGDLFLQVQDAWAQHEVKELAEAAEAEIGWALDPRFAGHGYATEAARELLRICFDDLGVRRVFASCFAANEPSWRLMERLGMRREQYAVADSLHRDGRWLDGVTYALLADEWRAAG